MKNFIFATASKSISAISKITNRGAGSTWPGHLALKADEKIITNLLKHSKTKIILVAGTNGKTTTGKMLATVLQSAGKRVFQNNSGANLLNGIASSLLLHTNIFGALTADYAIFEVDENNLPLILEEITPHAVIVLDLFRDQLDRYGELDSIAKKWKDAFAKLPSVTTLLLNADDPLVSSLGENSKAQIAYFGLTEKSSQQLSHAADSIYCPYCQHKLEFSEIYYSHLGNWKCPSCKHTRPEITLSESTYPLSGTYNKYNTLAAVLGAKSLGIDQEAIDTGLQKVTPAFGRQEKIIIKGKEIQIFLAKNPTSFNESLKTIMQISPKPKLMILLNDRIPDGTDVSWIWDIDIEEYMNQFETIYVGGDRLYDMALRLQYAFKKPVSPLPLILDEDLSLLTKTALKQVEKDETLFILPTYSAMLDVRKILTGRGIL